ncbi:MAG: AEC family transporter, partial [Candidatus Odinarchaeia archaeon]
FLYAITNGLKDATEIVELLVFSTIFQLILLVISIGTIIKHPLIPETKGSFILTGAFSNAIYLPVPVITIVLGIEAVVVATIFATIQIIIRISLGTAVSIYYSKKLKKSITKLLLNSILFPPFIATLLGFILFSFNFEFTGLIGESINFIGWLSVPASIFIIGLSLSNLTIHGVNFKLIGLVSIIQFIMAPVTCLFTLMLFNISDILFKALIIEAVMPPAISNILYANVFELDEKFTSACVAITTVVFLIVLPAVMLIITVL